MGPLFPVGSRDDHFKFSRGFSIAQLFSHYLRDRVSRILPDNVGEILRTNSLHDKNNALNTERKRTAVTRIVSIGVSSETDPRLKVKIVLRARFLFLHRGPTRTAILIPVFKQA